MIYQRLSNFKARLFAKGLSPSEVDDLVSSAEEEIRSAVDEIVNKAVNDAVDSGYSMEADEFLAQIRLDSHTGYVQITTDSGELDFSKPAFPMLPWLLKNAKTSKDGSLYKVIPVGADNPNRPEKQPIRDIASGLGAISSSRSGVEDMAEEVARAFNNAASTGVRRRVESSGSKEPQFRVASSKQDPSEKWVKPPKDLDLTGIVMSINSTMRSEIDAACNRILLRYEMEA